MARVVRLRYPTTGAVEHFEVQTKKSTLSLWREYDPLQDIIETLTVLAQEYSLEIGEGPLTYLTYPSIQRSVKSQRNSENKVSNSNIRKSTNLKGNNKKPTNFKKRPLSKLVDQCCQWLYDSIKEIYTPSDTLIKHILQQSYQRTMKKIKLSDFSHPVSMPQLAYGELGPELITMFLDCCYREILTSNYMNLNKSETCQQDGSNGEESFLWKHQRVNKTIQPNSPYNTRKLKFVDLGSGIGNIVFQVAMSPFCEMATGVEIQEPLHSFALEYKKELLERISTIFGYGSLAAKLNESSQLIFGDFFTHSSPFLKEADLILVNNFTFPPIFTQKLLMLFLELKPGAIVLSLVPFIPTRKRNHLKNDLSLFIFEPTVEQISYAPEMVSWSAAPGMLYLHRVRRGLGSASVAPTPCLSSSLQ